ncbi:MAG: enoyl-CoA hydratase/isomerase family protein [Desulfomonilaceae bacterium]
MAEVIFEKNGHIAFVRLNRPESLNAINRRMADALIEAWNELRDNNELWVGVVSGTGKAFCAGADIKEMERGNWKFSDSLLFGDRPLGPGNHRLWKPLVAATQGHVNGAGLWLALQCDIRVASDNARYGTGETRANVPALIAPFLSRYVPRGIAAELMYTARPINAQRAYDLGVVNRIVPEDQLLETATRIAESICECGPLSVWASKEMSLRSESMDFHSALAMMEHIATPVWNSQDSIEAKQAFIEKRKPDWQLR